MEEESLIGKQIGNYRLIKEIASGGFATVYQAQHLYLSNRVVALKLLHMHMPARERERFIQEAQFLESLQYRYILSVVDMGFDKDRAYLVSEYAPGGSLRQRLDQSRLLPIDQVLTILTQVGEALHYAHQQKLVHCDLKPENILFNAQGEAVLADFGIANVLSTMSVKQLANPEGTPSYMAPEQFRSQVSKESDQYALGCIAYELVSGQRPFSAPDFISMGYQHTTEQPTPPRQINAEISVHIEQAILKALAKQRNDRHQDVAAFVKALQAPPPAQMTKEEWLKKGIDLRKIKKHEDALLAYEQALRLDPSYTAAHYNKGNALHDLKRYKDALAVYEQAIQIAPDYALAYGGRGRAYSALKDYQAAMQSFDRALELDPTLDWVKAQQEEVTRLLKENNVPSQPKNKFSSELDVGNVLAEQYELQDLIEQGSFARIYRGRDLPMGRDVAIKVLLPWYAADRIFVERFNLEARLVACLSHPNVVTIHDANEQNGHLYIVTQFVDGGTLRHRLDQLQSKRRIMELTEVVSIFSQIADALFYIHEQGIIHRDIKPAHVLLARSGRPILCGFGIAGVLADTQENLTRPGARVGTPNYMSPEQCQGGPIDGRTDIYALGVMLFEAQTGRKPFLQNNYPALAHSHIYEAPPLPRSLNANIPSAIENIILKALMKNPQQRFQTAQEMRDALLHSTKQITWKRR